MSLRAKQIKELQKNLCPDSMEESTLKKWIKHQESMIRTHGDPEENKYVIAHINRVIMCIHSMRLGG